MDYRVAPFGEIWQNGMFNVPSDIVDRYIRLASEYQLKALLFIFRNNGRSSSAQIAKALGQTVGDIDDLLEFWIDEGVLFIDGQAVVQSAPVSDKSDENITEKPAKPKKETLSAPRLSPKDIVTAQKENEDICVLLNEAQVILGRTISQAEQEMLVNMVNYYGLKVEVIMMILEFYRSERERGKALGVSFVNTMAKDWADEGINTVADAEAKLQSIAHSDRLWNEIVAITGIKHRRPTSKQREMIAKWFEDFDITMVTLASDIMKENIPEPKLQYMNSILNKWKKKGITTPAQVELEQAEFNKNKDNKKDDKIKSKPTYDLDDYKKYAMNNTEI